MVRWLNRHNHLGVVKYEMRHDIECKRCMAAAFMIKSILIFSLQHCLGECVHLNFSHLEQNLVVQIKHY